jgi:indole-3-glycerol phosphate synthase
MVHAVPDILARVVDSKRDAIVEVARRRDELERRAEERTEFRDFAAALRANKPAIIAEIKKASPSKGTFTHRFDPGALARDYALGGAAALSVLTDSQYFQGCLADLEAARAAAPLPVLRKDFTIDEIQVIEAAAHGADAILLIAALLDESEMRRFRELAARYRMAALVEVHEESELGPALASGAEIIGVNNRNLHTFEVSLETSFHLAEKIPDGVLRVSESGLHSRAAIEQLQKGGFQAFLIGEHLMRAADPIGALRGLRG